MKLDYELIRNILLVAEEHCTYLEDIQAEELQEYLQNNDFTKVFYHIKYLCDCGYIELGESEKYYSIRDISVAGRKYLDTIRSDKMWDKVKAIVREKSLTITLEVLQTVGNHLLQQQIDKLLLH